jgi:Bacterial regulatory proteins, tetR family.
MSAAREVLAEDATAPVATIAGRAGVSRATFYRHFASRAQLLRSVALEPQPVAETRILVAAKDMLVRTSLAGLPMDPEAAVDVLVASALEGLLA